MRLAVIIPAFQAATTIRAAVAHTRAAVPDANVIVVDDGSSDGTGAQGRETGAMVVTHPRNRGKGVALRTGIARACAVGADIIVTLDADGQHPPGLIPRLVQPIADAQADLVLGARVRSGAMPLARRVTNWLSAALASRIGGQEVRDAQTGFRAFTRTVAERLTPAGDRYEYEANFLLDALRAGFRVICVDVPTVYGPRSHFRSWSDTWRMAAAFARHMRLRD
ncbi:MAG TPA: glycosyltransferase family 2 protein [Gemmatimonadales bacterium]|nr:glycosyltransferase family 2 protein [Gemmatimonadales bacterium]